jgi:hypothetical protein
MLSKCGDMGIQSLEVQGRLFDALVAPVLGYCAEVWGPTLLRNCATPLSMMSDELHCVQSLFLRRMAGGVRKSMPRHLLLREFGCRPLVRSLVHSSVSLWNRMIAAPASSLLHTALEDNMTLQHPHGVTWFASFSALLTTIEGQPQGGLHLGENH